MMTMTSAHTNSGSKNPISNDKKLSTLVHKKLPTITKYKQFQRWKTRFLDCFVSYLPQSGMNPASAASMQLQAQLESCLFRASTVLDRMEAGDLSPQTQRRTVKASQALKEFGICLGRCREMLEDLVPAKQIDENRKKYNKFHIGASLIQDGFPQFVAMKDLEEYVHAISDLTYDSETDFDSLNKQEREIFFQYKTQVTRFCDVMADLDLYDIMLKCVEFLHPPENEKDDDVEELTIFLTRYERYYHRNMKESCSSVNDIESVCVTNNDNGPLFTGENDDSRVKLIPPITIKVNVEDSETIANVICMVAEDLGVHPQPLEEIDINSQLTIRHENNTVINGSKATSLRQLGIENGDILTIEQARLSIRVRWDVPSEKKEEIKVLITPLSSVRELKFALTHQIGDDVESFTAENQSLFIGNIELADDDRSCCSYGIVCGSIIDLKKRSDTIKNAIHGEEERIVIVDTKYGTMFSIDRGEIIKKNILTPIVVNVDDVFLEASENDIDKDRMRKSMMTSPNLKVKPQMVIPKMKIEEYDIETADDVKSMWGIELRKSRQKQHTAEIFFVDLKTKAVGLLDRNKLMELNFITVIKSAETGVSEDYKGEGKTLEQAEKDPQKYDYFVHEIRKIFGIDSLGRV